ncbi:MAG: hypothetical protein CVU38_05260 [Chloroflexi bacterium HGW-Chloroflexi-1]|nr:MAG: hypothetical protein CVU38_05260 [Chloroflexi bacterium HGW-Chloroflexi-1]
MQFNLTDPVTWVAGSLALALIAANVAWLISRGRPPAGLLAWSGLPALSWLLTSLFLFLPPVAAWSNGALSPYFMGLSELNWIDALTAGGLLAASISGLTVFGWLVYRRTLSSGAATPVGGLRRALVAGRAALDAALAQWHLAFYRAAAIGWLAGVALPVVPLSGLLRPLLAQPIYWGSWLGLGLAALEWALNPFASAALGVAGQRETVVRNGALALATTALFVLTRNFWLCLGCHVAVELAVAAWFPVRMTKKDEGPTT